MNDKLKQPIGKQSLNWRHIIWFLAVWMFVSFLFRGFEPTPSTKEIPYSDFKQKVGRGEVGQITIKGNQISGKFKRENSDNEHQKPQNRNWLFQFVQSDESQPDYFQTVKPALQDPELLPLLEKNEVVIRAETQQRSWLAALIITLLPWLLIFGLFYYASKKMQQRMPGGVGGGIFGFSRSKAKLFDKQSSEVGYDEVAGLDNAKKELLEIVEYLRDPSRFQKLGGELPKGVLLIGPPGVGKTLMAQATAGEADVPFYSISGSEFIEMFVGVGASRVRDMFKKAKKDAPAIIFIDEIDSIGRVRGTGLGGGHDEREQTLNQILAEMDGFSPQESVVVMAATNRPDVLDPALVRPGRFDRRITLDIPQREARQKILETHTRKVPLADDVDLANLAERTVGLSGADLKNLVNEAALLAELLPGADPLQKVSIIPRGRALGATEQIPEEDRHNLKRSYLLNRIAITLGGRAAENIIFDDVSTGAGDDLKKATQLARRMVCQWGMSEKLGPVTFQQGEPHPFLGRELTQDKDFSEHTARLIDEEIQKIVGDMAQKAEETLSSNRHKLEALANELLKRETLNRDEVDRILADAEETAN